MKKKEDINIETILASIEFPGELDEEMESFLDDKDFTNIVMHSIEAKDKQLNGIIFWFLFTLINILLLSLLGTNQFVLKDFFGLHDALAALFYFFLGVTVFGGIIGLVIFIDTEHINQLPELLMDSIDKARHRFFRR